MELKKTVQRAFSNRSLFKVKGRHSYQRLPSGDDAKKNALGRIVSKVRQAVPFMNSKGSYSFKSTLQTGAPLSLPARYIKVLPDMPSMLGDKSASQPQPQPQPQLPDYDSTQSYRRLFKLQALYIETALNILDREIKTTEGEEKARYENYAHSLRNYEHYLKNMPKSDAGTDHIKRTKKLPKMLKRDLLELGLNRREVMDGFRKTQLDRLNGSGWGGIENHFTSPQAPEKWLFSSAQQPASCMAVDIPDQKISSGIFVTPYEDGAGVSCQDTKNLEHAANLWKSSFKINGKTVFNGIRSAILSPYKEKSRELREKGALKKVEETVIASLASKPELYQQALNAAKGDGSPPRLFTTSTSLVTTGLGSKKEDKMQKQQEKAFNMLLAQAKNGVLELDVPDPKGEEKSVKVKFELKSTRFNVPVNYGGVGALQLLTSGRITQHKMNKPAIAELLGKGREIGGETGEELKRINTRIEALANKLAKTKFKDLQPLSDEISELRTKKKYIEALSMQIKTIYKTGSHHSQGGDTYKLAARLGWLTHLIGGVPMYNCKSGKDRTGMMDAEIKLLIARAERDEKVPEPGPLDKKDQALFQTMLLNTGNHEVQYCNTRAAGYKTEHVDSINQRIGHSGIRDQVRGLSPAVGS